MIAFVAIALSTTRHHSWSFRPVPVRTTSPKGYVDIVPATTSRPREPWPLFVSQNEGADEEQNDDVDWRDFRARLVMKEKSSQSSSSAMSGSGTLAEGKDCSSPVSTESWAYESGHVIEAGSLIVSHPSQDFAYGGLRQQYFYKCVVLVVEHSPKYTRGIILNRPTDQTMKDDNGMDWNVWFGGDVQGIDSEVEALTCLHRLASPLATDLSIPILNGISSTPWEIAQVLVEAGEATREDFWLCCGYAGWAPGQLQNELHRGNWFMAAFDVESIWSMIGQELTNPQGTDMWVQVMKWIRKEYVITSSNPEQKFQDDMLKQWVRQKILKNPPQSRLRSTQIKTTSRKEHPSGPNSAKKQPFCNLSPGSLVRASSPILLDEQVFHQSLVLILQNNDDMTVGVVLNRPSSTSVSLGGSRLPVRYGGRFGLEPQVKPELWLHCNNPKLQQAKVGEPLSENKAGSIFWKCSRTDAETAVEVGLASAHDFVVVMGLSVWKKHCPLTGYKQSPVELDAFFTNVDDCAINTVWKLMNAQEPLNTKNAVENLEAANAAWMLSGNASRMLSGSKNFSSSGWESQEQQKVQRLALSALDKWIRTFLLKP